MVNDAVLIIFLIAACLHIVEAVSPLFSVFLNVITGNAGDSAGINGNRAALIADSHGILDPALRVLDSDVMELRTVHESAEPDM